MTTEMMQFMFDRINYAMRMRSDNYWDNVGIVYSNLVIRSILSYNKVAHYRVPDGGICLLTKVGYVKIGVNDVPYANIISYPYGEYVEGKDRLSKHDFGNEIIGDLINDLINSCKK